MLLAARLLVEEVHLLVEAQEPQLVPFRSALVQVLLQVVVLELEPVVTGTKP